MDELMSMKNKPRHYLFDFGGDYITHYFSLDFEPVQICFTEELHTSMMRASGNTMGRDYFQFMIDLVCEKIGKQKRYIQCHKYDDYRVKHIQKTELPGNYILEFIGGQDYGYRWRYYAPTKTINISNFYEWRELIIEDYQSTSAFNKHFQIVQDSLKMQGLPITTYYEGPSHKLIDLLTKQILNHGNSQRTS